MASKVRAMIGDSPTQTVFFWASQGGMSEKWALRHVQTICAKLAPLLKGQATPRPRSTKPSRCSTSSAASSVDF